MGRASFIFAHDSDPVEEGVFVHTFTPGWNPDGVLGFDWYLPRGSPYHVIRVPHYALALLFNVLPSRRLYLRRRRRGVTGFPVDPSASVIESRRSVSTAEVIQPQVGLFPF